MARELTEKTIDGKTYAIGHLDPFKALAIFTKLTKLLAPSATKLMAFAQASEKGASDPAVFGEVLAGIADRLDEDDVVKTAKDLLSQVLVDGRALNMTRDFGGNVPHMLAVLQAVIEVEFGGFLQLLPSLPPSAPPASE